jgi:hypothetical protein
MNDLAFLSLAAAAFVGIIWVLIVAALVILS